jgi:uncharacterized protein (AIM24 family)
MPLPVAVPDAAKDETYGGVTYHIAGDIVPVLNIEIKDVPVYFEHHVLLWKEPKLDIGIKSLQGAFKRMMAGMPVFVTETRGSGRIGFSRDGAGHIVPIHLKAGEAIDVREHQFLAATDTVDYTFSRVKGAANMFFSGSGFFIDTFSAKSREGVVWLHGYGNVFEVVLQPGEQIDVEPGGWIYKDRTVQMETKLQTLTQGLFASGGNICWNRFTGPGRVGIQSMYLYYASAE